MTEEEWLRATSPTKMLSLSLPACESERKRQLFACACARRTLYLLNDGRFAEALEKSERQADEPRSANLEWTATEERNNFPQQAVPHEHHAASAVFFACDQWFEEYIEAAEESRRAAELATPRASYLARMVEEGCQAAMVRDIFGNPFRPVTLSPDWRTDTAIALARTMYESRDFSAMPILADALQDAGCDDEDILNHCRAEREHVRGCWVVDLLLGKS